MHGLPLEDDFRAFAAAPTSAIAGALLVGRVVEPDTDVAWVHAELDRLAAGVPAPRDGVALVDALAAAGFAGAETYYAQANSSLAHVLRSRRGIPITLALVLLGVAERLGLPARGVNFPRHFLVDIETRLVDPFTMRVLEPAAIETALAAQELERAQGLVTAGPVDIVLRMLNNLRLLAEQQGDYAHALDLSGYQLLVSPDPFPVLVSRTDLWLGAGVPEMARRELEQAMALAPDSTVRDHLAARLATLAAVPTQLH